MLTGLMQQNVCIGLAAFLPALSACGPELPATRQTSAVDGQGQPVQVLEVKLPSTGEFVPCDSPQGARQLVTTNEGRLFYAGQALMNRACATQCHSSAAEGELRLGAPSDLDFDLPLVSFDLLPPVPEEREDLPPEALPPELLHLEVNQRAVYDSKEDIWNQVDKGHMPPEGYRDAPGLTFVTYDEAAGCSESTQMASIAESETRDILAVWLACGSPLIEGSDERITGFEGGVVGSRAPACEATGPGEDVTFDRVYSEVIEPSCATCHPSVQAPDYSTMQAAYDNMVNAPLITTATCPAGAPQSYVVPNDPEGSQLLHKMGDPQLANLRRCGALMPLNATEPLVAGTALVRAWIEQGALPPGQVGGGSPDAGATTGADGGM